jgi:UDP-N-acetyl-D-glucosamine dehydrogenase
MNKDLNDFTVCVVGQGYVGLPLAMAAVNAGYNVIGYDVDESKVHSIRVWKSPIEDVTNEDIQNAFNSGRYRVRSSLFEMQWKTNPNIFVVTVPTPLKDGRPDLSYVLAAAKDIGPYVDNALVILESTVAPGTTRDEFLNAIRDSQRKITKPGEDFYLAFSPERIDPGNKDFKFTNTPKLVAGYSNECCDVAFAFYSAIMDDGMVRPVASLEVAETAKLLENTFRHVNIALVNEMSRHLHRMDIDPWDVINAAATKPYGFMPFYPGPGVGGHCLPVDPAYLSDRVENETGDSFHFVDLAMRINESQPKYIVERVSDILNDGYKSINGSCILVMGYSYKANTADSRETPATAVVELLADKGANVYVWDPHSDYVGHYKTFDAALSDQYRDSLINEGSREEFDMVVLLTAHDEFVDHFEKLDKLGIDIFDTRNVFPRHYKNVHWL